jgi:5-methylthioadenosine/S-adenosylhomocysteine deaminase
MADLVILHGTVLTLDRERRMIRDGAVVIDKDRITDIGPSASMQQNYEAKKIIDAKNKIVMPGIVDSHVHNVQMLTRGLGDDIDLIGWCFDRIYPFETLMSDRDTYVSALLCAMEMIRTGTTCVCDPGGYRMDNVGNALRDIGMRGILSWAGMDQWSSDRNPPDGFPGKLSTRDTLREEERLVQRWHNTAGGRIRASYALRVEPNITKELYQSINRLAEKDKVLVQMHAAVSREQVDWVKKHTGKTTIEYMESLGILGPNWLLTHMAVLSDKELDMLKDRDVKVCHNPGASMHGAYGACIIGKFPEMLARGITVVLGTDSSAANNSLDMFRAMYQVATAHKEIRLVPDLILPEKALEMATIDGARALMWDDEIGSLEKGKKADVIIVDTSRPNWVPLHDFSIVPSLVYSGSGDDVETVIIDGQVIMEGRAFKTIDSTQILQEAQKCAERILQKLPYRIQPRWKVV